MFLPPAVMMMSFLRPVMREAVGVEAAEITGVVPAVLERLPGCVLVLVVALEDVRTLDQHLAVVGDPRRRPPSASRPSLNRNRFPSGRLTVALVAVSVIP